MTICDDILPSIRMHNCGGGKSHSQTPTVAIAKEFTCSTAAISLPPFSLFPQPIFYARKTLHRRGE
jgi:hypothetical protein